MIKIKRVARETGDSGMIGESRLILDAVARFASSVLVFMGLPGACAPGFMLPPASQARCSVLWAYMGLAPQALCFRLLRRLGADFVQRISR